MSKRAWQRMLSGRRLDLLDPSPLDIEIEDIAHGLAFVARWNGQTLGDYPYSVAAHSIFVDDIFSIMHPNLTGQWRLAALLHDAAEFVLGDLISPAKAAIGHGFGDLETRIQGAINLRFGLPEVIPTLIKRAIKDADLASAYLEAKYLAGFDNDELAIHFSEPQSREVRALRPNPIAPKEAKANYLQRFELVTQF